MGDAMDKFLCIDVLCSSQVHMGQKEGASAQYRGNCTGQPNALLPKKKINNREVYAQKQHHNIFPNK